MARNIPVTSFNGGEIGEETLLRTTLETYPNSAAQLENFLPKPAGPMVFRPGLKFCVELAAKTRGFDFVFDTQTYGLLLSDSELRIEQDGGVIVREEVTAAIAHGDFPTGLYDWTDVSESGGSVAGGDDGLTMLSNGAAAAGMRQVVTINEVGTTHGIRVVVTRGPVTLKLGSSAGGEEYLRTALRTGEHSIGVTPTTSSLSIEISSTAAVNRIVASVAIEDAGDLVLPTPWTEAQIIGLRHEQSNDVVVFASGVGQKKRIERRSSSSWSITDTMEENGPFLDPNTDESVTVTPSVRSGNGTLTASRALFKSTHVGALWQLTHSGQFVSKTFSGVDQTSEYVKVQGAGSSRTFAYTISGTFSATLTLQRSIGNTTSWTDVSSFTSTASSTNYTDGTTFDNQTVYYRFRSSVYASGSPAITMTYTGGSTDGVVRITGYTSSTVVDMEVLDQLGATTATTEWAEGAWSDAQSWPKAVALYDGRMWTGGYYDRFWGSKSDAYEDHELGDNADDAISRNVAIGTAKRILAFMPLARLIILTAQEAADVEPMIIEGGAPVIKSSAFDEPLTPSNLTIRPTMSSRGIYIDRDGHQAMEMYYSVEAQDYAQRSLMRLHEALGRPSLTQAATARRPDRRLFFVRSDGVLLVKLFDPGENVLGWSRIVTDGEIESVYVKPASGEDEVMVVVKRTIEDETRYYLEQMDPLYLASAADANRMDSFARKEDAAGFTVLDGLDHLEGETVVVWADGAAHASKVVSGGQITLDYEVTSASAGLSYSGLYKSVRPALGAQAGTNIGQIAGTVTLQFVLQASCRAIEYGHTFDLMDTLPDRDLTTPYDAGPGLWSGTTEPLTVPGDPSRDTRICIRVTSPHPATINGYVASTDMHERTA